MAKGSTPEQVFGNNSCWLYWFAVLIHNCNLVTGSLGMAIFRLLCIKFQKYALNPALAKQTVKKILIIEAVIDISLTFIAWLAYFFVGSNLSLEVCKGSIHKQRGHLGGSKSS